MQTVLIDSDTPALTDAIARADLGVAADAPFSVIRARYLRVIRQWHHDRVDIQIPGSRYQSIVEAYRFLSEQHLEATRPRYSNQETFVNRTNVYDIPTEDLIVLDGFAFDVNELVDYAESDISKLFINPHMLNRANNNAFSEDAKLIMRRHPKLTAFCNRVERAANALDVPTRVIDAIIAMLNRFDEEGVDVSVEARAEFLGVCDRELTKEQYAALDNYIVRLPNRNGGFQALRFFDAINGGNALEPCILTSQMYGWQFVVSQRPSAFLQIPADVYSMLRVKGYVIHRPEELGPAPETVPEPVPAPETQRVIVLTPEEFVAFIELLAHGHAHAHSDDNEPNPQARPR